MLLNQRQTYLAQCTIQMQKMKKAKNIGYLLNINVKQISKPLHPFPSPVSTKTGNVHRKPTRFWKPKYSSKDVQCDTRLGNPEYHDNQSESE